jgi:hypothetical protein
MTKYAFLKGIVAGRIEIRSDHDYDHEKALSLLQEAVEKKFQPTYTQRTEMLNGALRIIFGNMRPERDAVLELDVFKVKEGTAALRLTGYCRIGFHVVSTVLIAAICVVVILAQAERFSVVPCVIIAIGNTASNGWSVYRNCRRLHHAISTLSIADMRGMRVTGSSPRPFLL